MADDRMAVLETVRKAIGDGDADFLREGARVLAQAVMEAEVTQLTGVGPRGARPGEPAHEPQRVPGAPLGHPRGHAGARGAAGPRWQLLPVAARAAASCRAGAARGGPGGLCARRLDTPGRGSRRDARHHVDQQERGQPHLRRARRRGRDLPRPSAVGRGLSLPVARRDLREGARGRPGGVDGGARGHGCRAHRGAAGAGPRARGGQRRGLRLAGVHQGSGGPRPGGRTPGDQR